LCGGLLVGNTVSNYWVTFFLFYSTFLIQINISNMEIVLHQLFDSNIEYLLKPLADRDIYEKVNRAVEGKE
jgi:hypothetical protein